MSKFNNCLKNAEKKLKLTREELEDYTRKVFEKAKSYVDLGSNEAFKKAQAIINDKVKQEYFEQAQRTANNVRKYNHLESFIKDGKSSLKDLLIKRYNTLGNNIVSAQKASLNRLYTRFFGSLTQDEVAYLSGGKNDEKLCNIIDGKKIDEYTPNKIADLMNQYREFRDSELVMSNAMSFSDFNKDRFLRAVHDQSKLIHGNKNLFKIALDVTNRKVNLDDAKNQWKSFIKSKLDLYKTFKETEAYDEITGQINEGIVDKILDRRYDNIITNKSETSTRSEVVNDQKAVSQKSHMFFHWKDMRSLYDYNKVYGRGNLMEMLMSDMRSSSTKIGTAEMFGTNPHSTYAGLRNVQHKIKPIKNLEGKTLDLYFNTALQQNKLAVSPTLSKLTDNIRMLTSMSRLGKVVLQSVPDLSYMALFMQRMGNGTFKPLIYSLSHLLDLVPNEERKRIASQLKVLCDSHIGYMGRWADVSNSSELMNKMSNAFFKYTLLHRFDKGNKISIMHMMSKHLNNNSGKSFTSLDKPLQKWIGKFMTPEEWDLLRHKNQDGLFTLDNIDSITDKELENYQKLHDPSTPISDIKTRLYRQVYSMFDVAAHNAVLSPEEFEQAWLYGGNRPGTKTGSVLRIAFQFKSYLLAYLDRVLIQGWKDSDTAMKKLNWAASMMMTTLPLSIMSIWLSNIVDGKSTQSIFDPKFYEENAQDLINPNISSMMGVMDPENQNSNLLGSVIFGSPSAKFLSEAISAAVATTENNMPKAKQNFESAIKRLSPVGTVPFITPLINQAIGDKSYLQPGQTQLFGE